MMQVFLDPLQEVFFQKALIGGCLTAVVCGVVGCLVVLRRMAFLGDALSHTMIAGVVGGYLVMKVLFGHEAHAPAMLLGSIIAAITTVGMINFVAGASRIKEDTSIGIMYTGIFSLGVVCVSVFRHYIHIDIMHFIMGDVLAVSDADLWVSAFITALTLSIIILFFRYFQTVSFDPVMAASIGIPVVFMDYLLTSLVSLVVVSAVTMVGVILVVGLLITPAATAYLLCDRLDRMMALSALFGLTGVIGGLYLSVWLDSAGGGAVMLFCTAQFLAALIVSPKYGLLARRLTRMRAPSQELLEDILGIALKNGEEPVNPTTIRKYLPQPVSVSDRELKRAVRALLQRNQLQPESDGWSLTEEGRAEAMRIRRAHRLWETYLEQAGEPKETLHEKAHRLEHAGDGEILDYLDEALGHPDKDPHGSDIPTQEECDAQARETVEKN